MLIETQECRILLSQQFETIWWMAAIFGGAILATFIFILYLLQQMESLHKRLSREENFRDSIKQV